MAAKRKKSRKRREREAAELRKERLAYLGTLASGLAHEIRTPLGAIQMNIDLLAEELGAVSPGRRGAFATRVERIRRETRSLKKKLDEFLAFARPPKLQPRPLDLNAYLRELLEFLEPELKKLKIETRLELREDLYPVLIDPQQFGQVIMNVVANAREAVESRGQGGLITLRTSQTDEHVNVEVEDSGGGVPPGEEDRIFELFYSTKEGGTGLGLGIAARVVEEHGGKLVLENLPGKGARFVARLPKAKVLEFQPTAIVRAHPRGPSPLGSLSGKAAPDER